MNQDASRLPGLDLLRSIAVLWVVLFHYTMASETAPLRAIGQFGWAGVDLFFVLSGFLIGNQMFKPLSSGSPLELGAFYARRALRTLPNYLLVLAAYLAVTPVRESPQIAPAWKFLTFTLNFGLFRSKTGAFTHAWSLCVEEQFYLLLPLIAIALRKKGPRVAIAATSAIVAGGVLARAGIWHWIVEPGLAGGATRASSSFYDMYLYYPTYARLDGLLAGVCAAAIKCYRPNAWSALLGWGKSTLAAGLLLIVGALAIGYDKFSLLSSAFAYPALSLGLFLVVVSAMSPSNPISRIPIPGARFVATISYAMYLLQKMVFNACAIALRRMGLDPLAYPSLLGMTLALVAASYVLYVAVERPFLSLRQRLLWSIGRRAAQAAT